MANSKSVFTTDCDVCEARVAASLEGSYEVYVDAAEYSVRYLLLRCPECETALLAQQDNEHLGACLGDEAPRWGNPVRLYPHAQGRKLGAAVPEAINKVFSEAYACWKSKAYAACAAMCVKALKALCKAQNARGSDLAACLQDLARRGELDARLADWAMALNINSEAEMNVSQDHASDLLDFAEAAAEYIYTFKAKLDAFEKRRVKKRNPARRHRPVLTLISS